MTDDERLRLSIHTLGLQRRALTLLDGKGIRTVKELVTLGRAGCLGIRGFGQSSLSSVREALGQIGLKLIGES